ncbi:hypothetical protein VCH24_40040 [Variovorax boronicumulans]|nr:hypothetical protein VCH24_40040 [Variovorax boronicumulans]
MRVPTRRQESTVRLDRPAQCPEVPLLNDVGDVRVIPSRFTFHDLRAYYTTQHKAQFGGLPDLHADSKTTARVYDRSRVSERKGLG